MSIKIIIIGGGIAGLSAAHILSSYSQFKVDIYESEQDVGGQASSNYGKYCYTEYSWRIFGACYHNINRIIKQIDADNNFHTINKPCIINNDNVMNGQLSVYNLGKILLKNNLNINMINKLIDMFTICRDRAINDYDDINAYEHFNKNPIVQSIMGPFLGLDANKISLSSYYKNVLSVSDERKFEFTPNNTRITKYPTQESLFVPWVKYLKSKGVNIHTNSKVKNINIINNIINNILIENNGKIYEVKGDEYVFSCQLESINNIIYSESYFFNKTIKNNLKKLEKGLQLYYTINFYFSVIINTECNEFVLVDTPWKLIIQRKHLWGDKYLNKCNINNTKILEVFNIGFLDYNKGIVYGKILNECSRQEAINEGLYQFKNSEYIKKLFKTNKTTFEKSFLGYEDWHQFIDIDKKLTSKNLKFSTNTGLKKLMPNSRENDLPNNMYLSGYYVNSTMGGVSMESSCETGLNAGLNVINKYLLPVKEYPIKHNKEYIYSFTYGLILIDKILWNNNIKSINTFIPSSILILIYFLFIIFILVNIYKFIINKKKL
jgi:myosin-crossreactive antigen